jgi:hypothetical protein
MVEEEKFVPSAPDYKGDGVSIWKATDKNNQLYLRVSVLGGKAVNCFKYEQKHKPKPQGAL